MHASLSSKIIVGILAFAASAGLGNVAQATPAISVTNTTANVLGPEQTFTLGYQFTLGQSVTVSALGVFDSEQDGLVDSYPVGIYDSNGTQIAFATVASGSTEPLLAQFRYQTIAPVTLAPGTYQIGALYTTSDDGVLYPGYTTGFSTAASVAFVQNAFNFGATLADPTNSTSTLPSYIGPNFQFTVASVPEPASAVVIGAGIVALATLRRRSKR